jgi:hypothetical protein
VRVALAVAVLALVFVTAGCGGGGAAKKARRNAVAEYIVRVDTVEQQLRLPLSRLEKTYRDFGKKSSGQKATVKKLAGAEATLHTLQTRVSLIKAPPDAAKLRALMIKLTAAQVALAHELTTLAVFLPAFTSALKQLGPANARLKAELAAVAVPKPKRVAPSKLKAARAAYKRAIEAAAAAQADALDSYLAAIAKVQTRLHRLQPPPALEPSYRTQLATLARVRAAGALLVAALRAKQFKHVAELNRNFQAAATTSTSLTAQRAQIAAIKAFNARVVAIGAFARQVDTERTNVQKRLG